MKKRQVFTPVATGEQEAVSYLLLSLLKARKSLHCVSQEKDYDEDVNVYLSHLLYGYTQPGYLEKNERYVASRETDIVKKIDGSQNLGEQYFIFKVNGDERLMGLGIFRNKGRTFRDRNRFWGRSSRAYQSEARSYYGQAARWNERIYHRHTAVSEVLVKLSKNISKYVRILERVSKDYFDFFKSNFSQEYQVLEASVLKDQFLDILNQWMDTRDPGLQVRLEKIAHEIRSRDPNFNFSWDSFLKNQS